MVTQNSIDNRALTAVEMRIARAVIRGMLDAGYSITVDDGESMECPLRRSRDAGAILAAMMSTDEDYLHIHKPDQPVMTGNPDTQNAFGWVRFIYGNDGWDVVSDYTTNLESIMAPVNELADAIDNGTAPSELADLSPREKAQRMTQALRDLETEYSESTDAAERACAATVHRVMMDTPDYCKARLFELLTR